MKITCDSCGAKYTIADDKVSGRKVKIRCKGCGTPIVVDGAQPTASVANGSVSTEPEARVSQSETGAGAEWSVNLSETDQRTMSTQELVDGWASGLVTADAFVWKEGMSDWLPVLESPELAPLLNAPRVSAVPISVRPGSVRPAATTSRGGAGRAQAGADLFAGAATAGADIDDAPAAGPSFPQAGGHGAPGEESKPTGARNETSVLFSLDALKAGFSGAPAPAATKSNAPARRGPPGRSAPEDDPFGLGSAGNTHAAPMFSLADNNALLTAPAPPEPPPKPAVVYAAPGSVAPAPNSKKGLVMAIIAVLVVGGAGVAYALSAKKEKEEALQAAAAAAASAERAREDERRARAAEERAREEQKAAQAAPPSTAGEAPSKPPETPAPADDTSKAAAPDTPAATKPAPGKSDAAKPKEKETATPAPASGGDQPFNKSAAISALGAASGSAGSCKKLGGPTGTGKVTVTFATSGRVTSANVSGGPFAGTSVGGCVASLFRKAKVPPFGGNPVTVSKSFSIN